MNTANPEPFLETLRALLAHAPDTLDTSTIEAAIEALATSNAPATPDTPATPEEERVKIWFLLDRSGSMDALTGDVIDGFNQFCTEQAAKPGRARLTAVQFDDADPFEIVVDACRIGKVPELSGDVYEARGLTPLYDAIGLLIERADTRIRRRARRNRPAEDQLVIVFTDGYENASRAFNQQTVAKLIQDRKDQEWTFVFMGANQDSYLSGGKISLDEGNIQNYDHTPRGVSTSWESASRATREYRSKSRHRRSAERERFFGDRKEAEEEIRRASREK